MGDGGLDRGFAAVVSLGLESDLAAESDFAAVVGPRLALDL